MTTTLYLAHMNTGSFDFVAAGTTEQEALRTLRKAWTVHAREYSATYTWDDVAESASVHPISAGEAFRDNEPLRLTRTRTRTH